MILAINNMKCPNKKLSNYLKSYHFGDHILFILSSNCFLRRNPFNLIWAINLLDLNTIIHFTRNLNIDCIWHFYLLLCLLMRK